MTSQGVDYMNTQHAGRVAALKTSGVHFICRYYDGSGGASSKCLDAADALALIAAGLEIFTVFETAPTSVVYFTRSRGRSQLAMPKLRAALQDLEAFFATTDDLEIILHVNEVDLNWERGLRFPTL